MSKSFINKHIKQIISHVQQQQVKLAIPQQRVVVVSTTNIPNPYDPVAIVREIARIKAIQGQERIINTQAQEEMFLKIKQEQEKIVIEQKILRTEQEKIVKVQEYLQSVVKKPAEPLEKIAEAILQEVVDVQEMIANIELVEPIVNDQGRDNNLEGVVLNYNVALVQSIDDDYVEVNLLGIN